jgi:ABC-type polysaccharide/polyol phosphate transport system ATPase subunit
MAATVIEAAALAKRYRLGEDRTVNSTLRDAVAALGRSGRRGPRKEVWALRDVSFSVGRGEIVGVVGRNGAGKSTLLKILARITEPTAGVARIRGRVGALLEVGTAFHPELTGRENIEINGALLGMTRRDVRRRFDEIVAFAGVEPFLDTPIKRYSSGMRLRLAFAVAAHFEPEIVVVDEVLAVGDAEFQLRCLGRMSELGREGRTVLFVSHDMNALVQLCGRALWLDDGQIARDGPAGDVVEAYLRSTVAPARPAFPRADGDALELVEAQLLDAAGRPTAALGRDEPFGVALRLAVRRRVEEIDVSVWIANSLGVRVIDESSADPPARTARIDAEGDYVVHVELPPCLPPGDHVIGVRLASAEGIAFDAEVLALRVLARADDAREVLERRRAASPPVRWRVERSP